jgi:hypothetical protein
MTEEILVALLMTSIFYKQSPIALLLAVANFTNFTVHVDHRRQHKRPRFHGLTLAHYLNSDP